MSSEDPLDHPSRTSAKEKPAPQARDDARKARLSQALRDNLRRRKAQMKARKTHETDPDT
jgi:hypothetical protein